MKKLTKYAAGIVLYAGLLGCASPQPAEGNPKEPTYFRLLSQEDRVIVRESEVMLKKLRSLNDRAKEFIELGENLDSLVDNRE